MRSDEIIAVFEQNGCQLSTLRLAQKCIQAGVFDETDLNNAGVRWAQTIVAKALREKMVNGIPYAVPTTTTDAAGSPVWKQYPLWEYEDAEFALTSRVQALQHDYEPIVRLYSYMVDRWGKAPEIPLLVAHPLAQAPELATV